jgi:hypothetical protein
LHMPLLSRVNIDFVFGWYRQFKVPHVIFTHWVIHFIDALFCFISVEASMRWRDIIIFYFTTLAIYDAWYFHIAWFFLFTFILSFIGLIFWFLSASHIPFNSMAIGFVYRMLSHCRAGRNCNAHVLAAKFGSQFQGRAYMPASSLNI